MTQLNDTLLNKVRALLAKAESTDSPHEAELCTARATELMARHGIEEAMLNDRKSDADKVENKMFDIPGPYALDKLYLLNGLAKTLGCQLIKLPQGAPKGGQRAHVFGFGSDIVRLEMLFMSLVIQMTRALALQPVPRGKAAVTYRKSFLMGWTSAVVNRLEEVEKRARQEVQEQANPTGRSVALVLASRESQVERTYRNEYKSVRRTASRRADVGIGAGYAAGQRADIGQRRVAGQARMISG